MCRVREAFRLTRHRPTNTDVLMMVCIRRCARRVGGMGAVDERLLTQIRAGSGDSRASLP